MLKRKLFGRFNRLFKRDKQKIEGFDAKWYLSEYSDVALNGGDPELHYKLFGIKEGRFKNAEEKHLYMQKKFEELLRFSKDILESGSDNALETVLEKSGIDASLATMIDIDKIRRLNPHLHNLSDSDIILNILNLEEGTVPKLGLDSEKESEFYRLLAEASISAGNLQNARKLLSHSLYLNENPKSLESMANLLFVQKSYRDALMIYIKAIPSRGEYSKWVYINAVKSAIECNDFKQAMEIAKRGAKQFPYENELYKETDRAAQSYWSECDARVRVSSLLGEREELLNITSGCVKEISSLYTKLFVTDNFSPENSINKNRVLIIGDYTLPQCLRYRIEQKIEQFRYRGVDAEGIDWSRLEENQEKLYLYDIIIFYRTPAFVLVIKAIERLRSLGKVIFYEIDDLILSPEYPPSLESYGGAVDAVEYAGLLYGMPLFRECAKLCDYGIASTETIADELSSLVKSSKVFVHRNGLDSKSCFIERKSDDYIDIFYGSATLAHNEDFIELLLEPLERLLTEFDNCRLIIAGHLILPKSFRQKFAGRVEIVPKTKNVEEYWGILKRADINLAVLHKNKLNDAKSELKWLEAACIGIPSVVSGTKGYLEAVRNGIDALVANSSDEWYSALKNLITDEKLREYIAQNAKVRVAERYSIDILSQSLVDNIYSVIGTTSKKRKKVAIVNVFGYPQLIGGATRVADESAAILSKKYKNGFEAVFFCTDSEMREDRYRLECYRAPAGYRVYRCGVDFLPNMDCRYRIEEMREPFSKFLEIEKPDIIHFHSIQRIGTEAVEEAISRKIPFVVTLHDAWWISDYQFLVDENGIVYPHGHPDGRLPTPPKGIDLSESKRRREYLRSLLEKASARVSVSHSFAKIYEMNGVKDIVTIANGVSPDLCSKIETETDTNPNRLICAHIGGISAHKGYDILKEAVMEVQPEQLEFVIADHSKEFGYERRVKWGDVPVKFIGRIPQKRMCEFYNSIDVLFAVSLWPESFGLVSREAQRCGRWVVASSLGAIGEDIDEDINGFVIEPTVKNIVNILNILNSNFSRFKKRVKNDKISDSYRQIEKVVQLYERLMR